MGSMEGDGGHGGRAATARWRRTRCAASPSPKTACAWSSPTPSRALGAHRAAALPGRSTPAATRSPTSTATHTKRMHLIVVRRDLTGFQHLHPEMAADGTWAVPLRLGARRHLPRLRRLHATTASRRRWPTTSASTATPTWRRCQRPPPRATSEPGGYDGRPAQRPRDAGEEAHCASPSAATARPAALQPYLGAGGHLVALREGDLAFLHVHPSGDAARTGRSRSRSTFPTAGPLPAVPAVPRRRPASRPSPSPRRSEVSAVERQGAERVELPIEGMTCASCANRVERKLNELDGRQRQRSTTRPSGPPSTTTPPLVEPRALVEAVEAAGYEAALPAAAAEAEPSPSRGATRPRRCAAA